MKLIYIQTLPIGKKNEIPYRITIGNGAEFSKPISFLIRPEITIAKKIYEAHYLNRMELLSAPPFCDIADELIEIFQNYTLVFSERKQFSLLVSQFKTIGYNFNAIPKILWTAKNQENGESISSAVLNTAGVNVNSAVYGQLLIAFMHSLVTVQNQATALPTTKEIEKTNHDLSVYKSAPGVYFLLNELKEVLYVGKAKNIRNRLRGHFSNPSEVNNIDYSKVSSINVEYTGNDLIAQLIESDQIKTLKPIFNTQQVIDSAPFIINRGETAKGIHRLKITRKDIRDNMPEKYFNRLSVKKSLQEFCNIFHLCRKHCGLETVKGPCSNNTLRHQNCVCAGNETIEEYNIRFDTAFHTFQKKKSRKIYKLKGRSGSEDAFIYTVNGIYEGYGYIDKNESIRTENDILGHLVSMTSNYDTSRIIAGLPNKVLKENILILE